MNGRRWTDEEKARLLAMYKSGYRCKEISPEVGRTTSQVTDMLCKLLKQERAHNSLQPGASNADAATHGHKEAIAAARARCEAMADVPRTIGDQLTGVPEPDRSAWAQLSPEQRRAAL